MSFFLCIIVNSIDDIREEHIVIAIYNIDEAVFVRIFERDEVGIHEAPDKKIVLLVGILSLVMSFLFESPIWIDTEV